MEPIIIVVAVVVLLSVLYYTYSKKERLAQPVGEDGLPAQQPPQVLGILPGYSAYDAALRLENAIPTGYEQRVKERLQQRNPHVSDTEWLWRWHEVKRFLLMGALLRRVDMYSEQVDEVWHEMLMFTREYQELCERFCGHMIHHAPHGAMQAAARGQELGAERAWFDWVYGELFGPDNPGSRLWGAMYRSPLSPELLELLGQPEEDAVRTQLFNTQIGDGSPVLIQARESLLRRAREQLHTVQDLAARGERRYDRGTDDNMATWSLLGGTLMLASVTAPDRLEASMEEVMGNQQRHQGSTSSCGTAATGGDGRDARDADMGSDGDSGGGSDSGGSSCSGGGCGSS